MNEPVTLQEPPIPETLGKYQVRGVLGRGSMGVVYRGFDSSIERVVALKTVHTSLLNGQEADDWLIRFRQEARAAGRCSHPNIVTIFDYGEEEGTPYIAMEYIEGQELRHRLKTTQGPLELKEVRTVMSQMLSALAYAHDCGVVHRDIKPANIILFDDGRIKVTDFGIARLEPTGLTRMGAMLGTPAYMAPEQIMGREVDGRADLFATGVILYEMLAGRRPFEGETITQIVAQVLHRVPDTLAELGCHYSPALESVVSRSLAKDRDQRFRNAAQFATALEEALQQTGQPAAPAGQGPAPWNDGLLRRAEMTLTQYLGPVAKQVVKRAARHSHNLDELLQKLADSLPGEERERFIRRARALDRQGEGSLSESGSLPSHFPPEVLTVAQQRLAVHLGPIAKVLVKKAARQSATVGELYQRLADHLPREEQEAFLRGSPRS